VKWFKEVEEVPQNVLQVIANSPSTEVLSRYADQIASLDVSEDGEEEVEAKPTLPDSFFDKSIRNELAAEMRSLIKPKDVAMMARAIMNGTEDEVEFKNAKKFVEDFVSQWSYAKAPLYHMMGRKLRLEETLQMEVDYNTIEQLVKDYKATNPGLYSIFSQIAERDWIKNELSERSAVGNQNDHGTKVTKLLSKWFNSESINIEASKITQMKEVTRYLWVSIHPMDLLLMSENNSDWRSCQRLNGEYGRAAYSLIQDEATLVAYATSSAEEQPIMSLDVVAHNKHWRQLIFIDPDNMTQMYSRQYPNSNSQYTKAIRSLIEKQISTQYDIPNRWVKSSGGKFKDCFNDMTDDYHYNDITRGYSDQIVAIRHKFFEDQPYFNVGVADLYCPVCGDRLNDPEGGIFCYDCR
jgi:hypothetical protein